MRTTSSETGKAPDADDAAQPAPLRIDVTPDATRFVVALHGECDLAGAPAMKAAFDRALASGAPEVVVDLGPCVFADSTAMAALVGLNRRIAVAGGRSLLILPGPPVVQRVFALCGLLDILPFRFPEAS
ncbi:STAS domain-containing protein [Paraconexibacter sp. AEG42_29]|uniref:STAS domain-containing protein n=1 Tax=Paraconexibacter sp. AEG42_29 TaxID=2997339 RepID=UPI00339D7ECF